MTDKNLKEKISEDKTLCISKPDFDFEGTDTYYLIVMINMPFQWDENLFCPRNTNINSTYW
jgi:hypothetical protein